jgi:hypothetical protein
VHYLVFETFPCSAQLDSLYNFYCESGVYG